MVEKEIKVILSELQYTAVNSMFEWDNEVDQTNYYYHDKYSIDNDTEQTVRVRNLDGRYLLQVKMPLYKKGNLFVKREFEKEIFSLPNVITAVELQELTCKPWKSDMNIIGSLKTHRKVCHSYDDIEICLDYNSYLNQCDYEIEIEYKNDYPQFLVELLMNNKIPIEKNATGKHTRFINAYINCK